MYEAELPPGYLGCTDHVRRIIWLDSRLTQAERRATLGHEIGHLELDVVHGAQVARAREEDVDAWAARRLLSVADLVDALKWSVDIAEVAEELWVDTKTVRVRFRILTDEEQDLVMAAIARHRTAA